MRGQANKNYKAMLRQPKSLLMVFDFGQRAKMAPVRIISVLALALVLLTNGPAFAANSSDSQIKKAIIQESIANYSGNCPCPYNRASNGSRCGKRSAYSRPGGESPICYESDVTQGMIQNYKQRN